MATKHFVFALVRVNVWNVPNPTPVIPIATGVDLLAFSADDANLIVESLSLITKTEALVGKRDV
jgi:hypothetical protein